MPNSYNSSDDFRIADVSQIAEESYHRNDRFSSVILELNQRILASLVTMVQVDRAETAKRFSIKDERILDLLAGMDPNDILTISPSTNPIAPIEIDLDMLRVFEESVSPSNALKMSMEHMKNQMLRDIEHLEKRPKPSSYGSSRYRTRAVIS